MPIGIYKRTKPNWNKGLKGFGKEFGFQKGHKWLGGYGVKGKSGVYKRTPDMKTGKKKHTEETKQKIREKRKLQIMAPVSEETKLKISLANKGKKKSEEHIKNLKIARSKITVKPMLGKHHSEETKAKLRLIRGDKTSRWLGGKSLEKYSGDWTNTLKMSIRIRDKFVCKICNKKQENKMHHVHHTDYNKFNCNPNNLITLCKSCHAKTNGNRKYWINYFKNI